MSAEQRGPYRLLGLTMHGFRFQFGGLPEDRGAHSGRHRPTSADFSSSVEVHTKVAILAKVDDVTRKVTGSRS